MSAPALPRFSHTLRFLLAPALVFSVASAYGQVATTTSLSIASSSVTTGAPTLLTATVAAGGNSVKAGTVSFYDGARSLGSAQIVSGTNGAYPQGTANLKTNSFTVGANSITAVFEGTKNAIKSSSAAKTVTVTGPSQSSIALKGFATGTDFWLPATLYAFGPDIPSGNVDYVHAGQGATIGTKPLTDAKWKMDFAEGTANAGSFPEGIVTGDFNGDGFLDVITTNLVATNPTGMVISVALSNGDGTFQSPTSVSVSPASGYPIFSIYTADFNNDGKLDLAVINQDNSLNSKVGILLGNGDGTFQPEVDYGPQYGGNDIFIGDFDRDGNLDVVMAGYQESNQEPPAKGVAVFLGNGDGTFQTPNAYPLGPGMCCTYGRWVRGGDLNGDGLLDLFVTTDSGARILLGKGDGSFSAPIVASTLQGNYINLADLNGDGKLDAVLSGGSGQISTALGNGDGTFQTPQSNFIQIPVAPVLADFNQDGKLDIAFKRSSIAGIYLLMGNGDGTFQSAVTYLPTGTSGEPMVAGDFNGDGWVDLASPAYFNKQVNIALNARSTELLLAKHQLGPGTTTVQASYSGDAAYADSASNRVVLTPNGSSPARFSDNAADFVFNGSAALDTVGFLALTSASKNEAGSIFYGAPQNIQAFTTDFAYGIVNVQGQPTGGSADGLTFTIQNSGPNAVGGLGGGLGYKNIVKSVAVKFDLYNNSGEGSKSIGLYVNGANPTLPAVDLSSNKISLTAAQAHVVYDGTTLTLTIKEISGGRTFTQSWPIDIPAVVGGPTAYVGFTGGTGSNATKDEILSWSFTPAN